MSTFSNEQASSLDGKTLSSTRVVRRNEIRRRVIEGRSELLLSGERRQKSTGVKPYAEVFLHAYEQLAQNYANFNARRNS